jgi:hypothetical protein
LGNGAYFQNNRHLNFQGSVFHPGYTQGSKTGVIFEDNDVLTVDASISTSGVVPYAASRFIGRNQFKGGKIISDHVIRGDKINIEEIGEVLISKSVTGSPVVVGTAGNFNLKLNESINVVDGQRAYIYKVTYTIGGDGVGMEGLVFRINDDFSTTLDSSGSMELIKYIQNDSITLQGGSSNLQITSASNASPIVITTSGNHGLQTGDTVTIQGVEGNTAANVNGNAITRLSSTTFSLDGTTGNGAYTANGEVLEFLTSFDSYLHNSGGTNFTIPVGAELTFHYKIIQYTRSGYDGVSAYVLPPDA